ncbi:hypothetical protein CUMW_281520 [Citrus unshiu]|uniref:LysM domain-containing protein n=1 Tax=Citrus unshiu TaxID=55188 RepID=A0A2H5MY43_CITUN|nr:hypothetical protein CUMW_281520 [Citrus unshiu]
MKQLSLSHSRSPSRLSPPHLLLNSPSSREPEPASCRIVEILRGDTLWGFSMKCGVSIDAIKEANGLSGSYNVLVRRMVLKLGLLQFAQYVPILLIDDKIKLKDDV